MEDKRCTAMVPIDLSAAFDTVDHKVLLDVLHNRFGIDHIPLRWLESYLQHHSYKVNGQYSSEKYLDFSEPQGSCTGPVLYLSYASTMSDVIADDIILHLYADDHALKKAFPANNLNSCGQIFRGMFG